MPFAPCDRQTLNARFLCGSWASCHICSEINWRFKSTRRTSRTTSQRHLGRCMLLPFLRKSQQWRCCKRRLLYARFRVSRRWPVIIFVDKTNISVALLYTDSSRIIHRCHFLYFFILLVEYKENTPIGLHPRIIRIYNLCFVIRHPPILNIAADPRSQQMHPQTAHFCRNKLQSTSHRLSMRHLLSFLLFSMRDIDYNAFV